MDDELIEGLVGYRKKEDISQKEMVNRLNAVEGAKPISKAGYTAIEQQRKGRKASRASVSLLMRYFQSIKHAKMVETLLRCIDTDPAALHQQLEAAAWQRLSKFPPDSTWVSISYKWQGKTHAGGGYFDGDWYLDGFGKLAPNHMRYKDILIYAWQPKLKPAPMLEAGQGGR